MYRRQALVVGEDELSCEPIGKVVEFVALVIVDRAEDLILGGLSNNLQFRALVVDAGLKWQGRHQVLVLRREARQVLSRVILEFVFIGRVHEALTLVIDDHRLRLLLLVVGDEGLWLVL